MPMRVFRDHAPNAVKPPPTLPQLAVRDLGQCRQHIPLLSRGYLLGMLTPHRHRHATGITLQNDPLWGLHIPISALFQRAQQTVHRYPELPADRRRTNPRLTAV